MTLYAQAGLERFDFEGQQWPPGLSFLPDAIMYADIRSIDFAQASPSTVPPQALSAPTPPSMPMPSFSFPSLQKMGDLIGPVRIRVLVQSGGNTLLDKTSSLLSSDLAASNLLQLVLPGGEVDKMKRLMEAPSGTWNIETTVLVECAQPYTKKGGALGFLFALITKEADWYWVETARKTFSSSFDILKPKLIPTDMLALVEDPTTKLKEQVKKVQDDMKVFQGQVLSQISNFKVELPDLDAWWAAQGIQDQIAAFVTRTDLDGVIQGIQFDTKQQVDAALAKSMDQIGRVGSALTNLIDGQVYSLREDLLAQDTRVENLRQTFMGMLAPLRTKIGEQLTKQDVQNIVAEAIERLRADLTPPTGLAVLAVYGPGLVDTQGSAVTATLALSVAGAGTFRIPGYVAAQQMKAGYVSYQATFKAGAPGVNSQFFTLEAQGPNGGWTAISQARLQYTVAGLAAPLTGDPPDFRLQWGLFEGVPVSLPVGSGPITIANPGIQLLHDVPSPGAGFGYGFRIMASVLGVQMDKSYFDIEPGLWHWTWPGSLDVRTTTYPEKPQELAVVIQTYIHRSPSGEIYKSKTQEIKVPFVVSYPEPKFSSALKPPTEALPGQQFPLIMAWENQSKTAGLIRVGGYEVNAPPGPSTMPLFGTFPDSSGTSKAETAVLLEVLGPGKKWQEVDRVSYKTWRLPAQAKFVDVKAPVSAKPGATLSLTALVGVTGVPKGANIPLRLMMGETELARGSADGNGQYQVSPSMKMPDSPLGGTLKLQVYDNFRDEGNQWLDADVYSLFLGVERPLPSASLQIPSSVPGGEPLEGSLVLVNLGDEGQIKAAFTQESVFSQSMGRGQGVSIPIKLKDGIWDDAHLVAQVEAGNLATQIPVLVKASFPSAVLRDFAVPETARVGSKIVLDMEIKNIGDTGVIGVVVNGVEMSERASRESILSFRYTATMPAQPAFVCTAVPFFIGRMGLRVTLAPSTQTVLARETAFVTDKELAFYGAPGLEVVGLAVAESAINGEGWDIPVSGPIVLLRKAFRAYEVATISSYGWKLLYFTVTQQSDIKDFAVVENGKLVYTATTEYKSGAPGLAASSKVAGYEHTFKLPSMAWVFARVVKPEALQEPAVREALQQVADLRGSRPVR